tara:strand:- start:360 stop:527 length:168 start_codon:yes stop_codon:yes gene_type:complete
MAKKEEAKEEISIDDKIDNAIEDLENKKQNYKIMLIKMEGALEVLIQLKGNKKNE